MEQTQSTPSESAFHTSVTKLSKRNWKLAKILSFRWDKISRDERDKIITTQLASDTRLEILNELQRLTN